jgi:hypothetical protein
MKEGRKTAVKMNWRAWKVPDGNRNTKLAYSTHRPEGMNEYVIGSQAVLEQKKK